MTDNIVDAEIYCGEQSSDGHDCRLRDGHAGGHHYGANTIAKAFAELDHLASHPKPVEDRVAEFFDRPGDFYLVNVMIALDDKPLGMKYAFQFAIKADEHQRDYAAEIMQQLRGALGQHSKVTMGKAQQLDRLPGTTEAYAVRPPTPAPEYAGKHRDTDELDCIGCGKLKPREWCYEGRTDCPCGKPPRYPDAPGNFPEAEVRLTEAGDGKPYEFGGIKPDVSADYDGQDWPDDIDDHVDRRIAEHVAERDDRIRRTGESSFIEKFDKHIAEQIRRPISDDDKALLMGTRQEIEEHDRNMAISALKRILSADSWDKMQHAISEVIDDTERQRLANALETDDDDTLRKIQG